MRRVPGVSPARQRGAAERESDWSFLITLRNRVKRLREFSGERKNSFSLGTPWWVKEKSRAGPRGKVRSAGRPVFCGHRAPPFFCRQLGREFARMPRISPSAREDKIGFLSHENRPLPLSSAARRSRSLRPSWSRFGRLFDGRQSGLRAADFRRHRVSRAIHHPRAAGRLRLDLSRRQRHLQSAGGRLHRGWCQRHAAGRRRLPGRVRRQSPELHDHADARRPGRHRGQPG